MLAQVSENVASTINVPYEIIARDNSKGQMGLCELYNTLAATARYDILCFMHEDIIINTANWGKVLVENFINHPEIGLLGVVGGSYKPLAPSTWGGLGISNDYANIIQTFKYKKKAPLVCYRNPHNVRLQRVACIDGLFMCTTKKIFSQYKFDEKTFKGFHVYDIDYAITVGQQYKVAVTFDIQINHLSEGGYNTAWMLDNLKFQEKWNNILPLNIEGFTRQQQIHIEKVSFKHFVGNLLELNMPISYAFKVLWKDGYLQKFPSLFFKLHYYVLKLKIKAL